MKLGISINLFDGEELLETTLKCIRNQVDYVSVVYQKISNMGYKCSDNLMDTLNDLYNKKYIDELYEYFPTINNDRQARNHTQEIEHRNVGLELSRKEDCTHHMSMDVDEFYIEKQFAKMKEIIENGDYDASVCHHNQYYKDTIYMTLPKEEDYVGAIYKINPDTKYVFQGGFPPTDPTRKTNNTKYALLNRDIIEMHHMNMVRKDLYKKLMSHNCRADIWDEIEKIVEYYNNWKYPMPALLAGMRYSEVVEVPRIFPGYIV